MTDQQVLEAEFRGFFYGEGTIDIRRYVRKGRWESFTVVLTLCQRVDNAAALDWLVKHFGGTVGNYTLQNTHGRKGGWRSVWQLAERARVKVALGILLEGSLPATKRGEAEVALQFLDTIKAVGHFGGMRGASGGPRSRTYSTAEREQRAQLYARFRAVRDGNRAYSRNYQPEAVA